VVSKILEHLHEVQAAIDQKYNNLGGAPGKPTTDIEFGAGEGYYRRYEHGAIYWHPQLGAYWVHGAIYEKYIALGAEASFLGYPLIDVVPAFDAEGSVGEFTDFQGGTICSMVPLVDAQEIHGAIRDKWVSFGGVKSFLGFPTTDEIKLPDGIGRLNHFHGGSIYWTANTGAHEVHGAIRDKWAALGWQTSYLGYPTSDEMPWTHPNTKEPGRKSNFERGVIAWTSHSGAFDLPDTIILESGPVNPPEPITGWAELTINSAGGFRYRGHLHDSGAISYHVAIASALNFQDSEGHVFVATEEGYTSFSSLFGDTDHDWDKLGFEPLLRDNWDALRFSGMSTILKVNVTVADVIEAVLVAFPFAFLTGVGIFVIQLFQNGDLKFCPGFYVMRHDPLTGEERPAWQAPIVGRDDPCPTSEETKIIPSQ